MFGEPTGVGVGETELKVCSYGLGSLNLVKLYQFEDKSSDLKVKNN